MMKTTLLRPFTHTSRQRQRGVSLLEVLVAMLILAFGLLGLIALQMTTLRNNQSAFDRSRAIMAAYSVADIKRAEFLETGTLSEEDEFPEEQLENLKQHLGATAEGEIDCTESTFTPTLGDTMSRYTCDITITWDDSLGLQEKSDASHTDGDEAGQGRLVMQVQL